MTVRPKRLPRLHCALLGLLPLESPGSSSRDLQGPRSARKLAACRSMKRKSKSPLPPRT
jgi:hypothetical protein